VMKYIVLVLVQLSGRRFSETEKVQKWEKLEKRTNPYKSGVKSRRRNKRAENSGCQLILIKVGNNDYCLFLSVTREDCPCRIYSNVR